MSKVSIDFGQGAKKFFRPLTFFKNGLEWGWG